MSHSANTTLEDSIFGCAEQLARFFPDVQARQFQLRLQRVRQGSAGISEVALVQYVGAHRVIFSSTLALEFEEPLLLNHDGRKFEARVVGVQYHAGRSAVAVQILNGPLSGKSRP